MTLTKPKKKKLINRAKFIKIANCTFLFNFAKKNTQKGYENKTNKFINGITFLLFKC